jgi:hypothetical protein
MNADLRVLKLYVTYTQNFLELTAATGFQLYQHFGDRIRLHHLVSAMAQNHHSQITYSHKAGSPGKTLLEMCDFIFLSDILSVYCEGIEPAAPKLT